MAKSFVSMLALASSFVVPAMAQNCWKNLTCSGPDSSAFPGPWEKYIYAPASRNIPPAYVVSLATGNVISDYSGSTKLSGNGSALVYDFGKEVGGLVSLNYTATAAGSIGLAFTEAKNFIGEWSDSSNGKLVGPDGAIYSNFTEAGSYTYTMPDVSLRGGFRYLTLFLVTNSSANVTIEDVSLEIGFQPTWSNLRAYQGYFESSDDLLNRIWYGGAYTLQTNAVPVNTGRRVPFLTTGWANDGILGPGDTIIVDGAKRDRAVWPGDMGIAVPSTYISIGDLDSVKNALQTMYNNQNSDGSFPEAGPPLLQQNSDTYHMWTMIGTYNYLLYTNDTTFLSENWSGYTRAMSYIYGKVLAPGLLNVTGTRDWARWATGGNGSEPNMILYRTLVTGSSLAQWIGDTTNLSSTWSSQAVTLKANINEYLWDANAGAFKDNATATTLIPQDANSMAILWGVVNSTRAASISKQLTTNWGPIGPESPELPNNVSPFISGFELQGHLNIRETQRALDVIRTSWGWYINNKNGSESTVIEGYLTNGSFSYRADRGYNYNPSYPSHSHGWSSGPTSALTEYVLGLSIAGLIGTQWTFAPQFGDLSWAKGGFVTELGKYEATWTLSRKGYSATLSTPTGTSGTITLPYINSRAPTVKVNGKQVKTTKGSFAQTVEYSVKGGSYTISVS